MTRDDALSTAQTAECPRIDLYACAQGCSGKFAVIFELDGAYVQPEPGFVEREVARRGAFFPADYAGGRHGRDW